MSEGKEIWLHALSTPVPRDREKAYPATAGFLLTGPIGILFYNLFPALGPAHIFLQGFPWHPMSAFEAAYLLREPIAVKGVQNAIPSLHMAWVLLAWWYSRGLSVWERGIALTFAVFTALATLGTGEHYFIDLIVAYPFSVMLQSLCAFPMRWAARERVTGMLYGLPVTLLWLVMLGQVPKVFWFSPVIPWACCLLTVASAIYLHRKLEAATEVAVQRQTETAAEMAVVLS